MKRTPEPELMSDPAQAAAYARADFAEPHDRFVALFAERFPGLSPAVTVLDLGCGPADITLRFARAHPGCELLGVDGAAAMLAEGERLVADAGLAGRIRLHRARLPVAHLPGAPFGAIISNSLLHHLHDPAVLWEAVHRFARPGAPVFIMDLRRPASPEAVDALVAQYAAGEPPILRRDFRHSLHAAFTPDEVARQLQAAGLDLTVEPIGDRHLIVHGQFQRNDAKAQRSQR